MLRHNIPTAAYKVFTDLAAATEYVKSVSHRVVIKVRAFIYFEKN